MAEKNLRSQVALVTGAGQGIGFAICQQLVARGAFVLLNDVDESLAEEASRKIDPQQVHCKPVAGDCSNNDVIGIMVEQAVYHFGKLDIAVANAGITLFGDFLSYKKSDFDRVVNVNLSGSFFLAQAAARQMKTQGTGGRILFMSSVTGHQAHEKLAAYGMTKAALEMLAKTLVIELSQYKITVNAIAPGATINQRTANDPAYFETWSRITPVGRPASTEDIAHAAAFLVSPEASHITGQTLVVDGGWTSVSPSPY